MISGKHKKPFIKSIFLSLLIIIISISFISATTIIVITQYPYYPNADNAIALKALHPSSGSSYSSVGQTFLAPNITTYLDSITVYLYRTGSPNVVTRMELYALDIESNLGVPTGEILHSSSDITLASGIIGSGATTPTTITYEFNNTYSLVQNKWYALVLTAISGTIDSTTNYVNIKIDASTPSYEGQFTGFANSVWNGVSGSDATFYINGIYPEPSATPTPTPTPSPSPTPDKLTPILEDVSLFFFGDSVLGAGFGLIILLICCVVCVKLGGKSFEMVLLGAIVATIVNVSVGIWEIWTIILLIIAVVAIALKNSGVLNKDGE